MKENKHLAVFQWNEIRKKWYKDEWYFSVIDVILVLTESDNPRKYWSVLKTRLRKEGNQTATNCSQLKLSASDGKMRLSDVANTKELFRLIQSIPSKKAGPFKLWLAKVGYERIQEIENPELAQDRAREYYKLKGYPKNWIEKRVRGIGIHEKIVDFLCPRNLRFLWRQELTDEWKDREINTENEFAILTNEISKATFGKTVGEYK